MKRLSALVLRLWRSAVVWSWVFNALRLSSGILLLPLLLRLPSPDFGFYFVLLSIVALTSMLDLGFAASIHRAVSYAMCGATELKAQGMAASEMGADVSPNFALLWRVLYATRTLYRFLSIGTFLILGGWGTYVVSLRVNETSDARTTWLAWGLTLAGGVFEMYAGWWNAYLHGLNQVLLWSRIVAFASVIRLALSCGLLLGGAGLLAVPLSIFVASFVQRSLSRHYALKFLSARPAPPNSMAETKRVLTLLWPNSWRGGCQYLSSYLNANANTFLCMKYLGLQASGQYGLSLQIVVLCQAMSQVWLHVKWPLIFQLRSRAEFSALQRLFRPRLWLLALTFFVLGSMALAFGQPVLDWLNAHSWRATHKILLPRPWLGLLLLNAFLDLQFGTWTWLLLAGNHMPYLWPAVATNVASLLLVIVLLQFTSLGMGALVLGPLLAGAAFNYWNWPKEGAKSIETTLVRLLFGRQPN